MLFRMLGLSLLGGLGYPLLEILFRGRTHITMALAGALCLPMLRLCARLPCARRKRAAAAALLITLCEGCIGCIWNRNFRIWDYRKNKGNIAGQICPKFTLLWFALSYLLVSSPRRKHFRKIY